MVEINCKDCNISFETINRKFKICDNCRKNNTLIRARNWKKNNTTKNFKITDDWRKNNKDYINKYNVIVHRKKKLDDPSFKILVNFRCRLN